MHNAILWSRMLIWKICRKLNISRNDSFILCRSIKILRPRSITHNLNRKKT
jgi:hypothetical protein